MAYVDVNGVHTYYEEHGSGDPLLLLHGGLSDAEAFAQQTPVFAERYRVILSERRGHAVPQTSGGPLWEVTAVDPAGFDAVTEKMQRCWFDDYEIPKADLARIEAPTLVMVGDDDIATFEHTLELWETIPDSQLAVIPGASHLVPTEKADIVNRLVPRLPRRRGSDDDLHAAPARVIPLRAPAPQQYTPWCRRTHPDVEA